MHQKKILFVFSQAPYTNSCSQSGLDNLLIHASFACTCNVLFIDAGVTQLDTELAAHVEQKNISKQLAALPLYEVHHVYACSTALKEYRLTNEILATSVQPLEAKAICDLFNQADFIYHY